MSATPNTVVYARPFINANTQVPCTGSATVPGVFTDLPVPAQFRIMKTVTVTRFTVTQSGCYALTTTPNLLRGPGPPQPTHRPLPQPQATTSRRGWAVPTSTAWSTRPSGRAACKPACCYRRPQPALPTDQYAVADCDRRPIKDGVPVSGRHRDASTQGTTLLSSFTQACAAGGVYRVAVPGSMFGPVGAYPNVFAAVYSGGVADMPAANFHLLRHPSPPPLTVLP